MEWTDKIIGLLSKADRTLSKLAGIGSTFSNPHIMLRPFIRREAVLSSRIEGTRSTLEDIYKYEATQLSFLEPTSDVREVHNYVKAVNYGLDRLDTLPVSLRLVRELHEILMEGEGGHLTPGKFRRSQNWIGSPGSTIETAAYVPPPVEQMKIALNQLEEFIHSYDQIPPLIKLGLIHYQFEAIHPFLDGNGRIGRLLITLLLCEWKMLPHPLLYLSGYFENRRQEYYDRLLTVSQKGTWQEWLEFFLDGVKIQSQESLTLIEQLQSLQQEYYQKVAPDRVAEGLQEVIDLLLGQPIVTVKQVMDGISAQSYTAANRYVDKLIDYGILQEVSGRSRNRLFRANKIIEIIRRPYG